MILGRPVNLWLGAATAVLNLAVLLGVIVLDAIQLGAANVALAAIIALVANATPTVREGDTVKVVTPGSAPNRTITA